VNTDKPNLKEIVMQKRNILAAAVLVSQALAVGAHAAPSESRRDPETFYAGNPVADPAPTPPGFRQGEIRNDPTVFYSDNPVPAPADAGRTDSGRVHSAPAVRAPGGHEATGSSHGDAQLHLVNPF
jgi:hypothetical protein